MFPRNASPDLFPLEPVELIDPIEAWKRKNEAVQIPLPDIDAKKPGEPGYELWRECSTAGLGVMNARCGNADARCRVVVEDYRDACFARADSDEAWELSTDWGVANVDDARKLLVAIVIDGKPVCTGTLLGGAHVMTAGHCNAVIRECRPETGCVVAAVRSAYDAAESRLVSRLTPAYSQTDPFTDFAIWTLQESIDDVPEVGQLDTSQASVGESLGVLFVGAATFPCDTDAAGGCNVLWRPRWFTECAITCGGGGGLLYHQCQSDGGMSGAPMIVPDQEGELRIAAIHSRHQPDLLALECPGDTQVAIPMSWICRWIESSPYNELKGACRA